MSFARRWPGDVPLALPGPILAMDTTCPSTMDYAVTLSFVRMALGGARDAGESFRARDEVSC